MLKLLYRPAPFIACLMAALAISSHRPAAVAATQLPPPAATASQWPAPAAPFDETPITPAESAGS